MKGVREALVVCLPLAVLANAGCTRSYDGTIVPRYTAELEPGASATGVVYRLNDLEPRSRLIKFPPPPPTPASSVSTTAPAPAKRRAGRLLPRIEGNIPRKVSCRNVAGPDGRIRVVCL